MHPAASSRRASLAVARSPASAARPAHSAARPAHSAARPRPLRARPARSAAGTGMNADVHTADHLPRRTGDSRAGDRRRRSWGSGPSMGQIPMITIRPDPGTGRNSREMACGCNAHACRRVADLRDPRRQLCDGGDAGGARCPCHLGAHHQRAPALVAGGAVTGKGAVAADQHRRPAALDRPWQGGDTPRSEVLALVGVGHFIPEAAQHRERSSNSSLRGSCRR